ncbi:MAG: YqeG family HAD IIIA-type phosphatase [Coriobacteriia bacterium]|nr:YqeG family HAD IIIA-type phosphatase [Coriobacteriia bacterium]
MAFPDFFLDSVLAIDLEELKKRGIVHLLLDLDNTLLPRDSDEIPPEIKKWALSLKDAGFKACILSNNWHNRITEVAGDLGLELVSKAVKPLPPAYFFGMRKMNSRSKNTVMIGDQVFTDILGASCLGITTVLVSPLSSHDLKHTLFLRKFEKLILGDRHAEASM